MPSPFILETWTIRGVTYTDISFMTSADLRDSLNVIDPDAYWTVDMVNGALNFIGDPNDYGVSKVYNELTGSIYNIVIESQSEPNGVQVSLGLGNHTIVMTDNSNGCIDTVVVIVTQIPDCSQTPVPTSFDVLFGGGNFPELMATADGLRIDWNDHKFNGNRLLQDSEVFIPGVVGTFYTEAVDEITGCSSPLRKVVPLIQVPRVIVMIDSTICSVDNYTYDVYLTTDGATVNCLNNTIMPLGHWTL